MKYDDNRCGYSVVIIRKNGKHHHLYIHRLVAEHFIENKDNKPCINHIDGNKKNNIYTNLEWTTYKENMQHAIKNGLHETKWGGGHPRKVKITYSNGTSIIYKSYADASKKTGYKESKIQYNVCHNPYPNEHWETIKYDYVMKKRVKNGKPIMLRNCQLVD